MGSARPPLLNLDLHISGTIFSTPPKVRPPQLYENGTSELGSSGSKSYLGTSTWLSHTHRLESNAGERLVKFNRLDNGASASVYKAVDAETLQLLALKEVAVTDAKSRDMVRHEVAALELQRVPGSLPPRQRPPLGEAGTAAAGSESAGDLDGFADDPELFTGSADEAFKSTMSPYIVKFYGCTVRQGGAAAAAGGLPPRRASCATVTLALEYCCGGNLQAWVDAKRPWSVPWVALLATQSLSALQHLHLHRRLHRDVKPANLLLTRGGGVKVADFGLSIVSRPGENGMKDTMVGTKAYMAPERLRAERYNHQSDVFSLGLVLASVVFGECPVPKAESEFEQLGLAETAAAMVRSRCHAAKKNSQQQLLDIPPLLADMLAAMLGPDAAARPGAAELLQHPFLKNVPQFPSSSLECAAVVEALAEQRRRGQRPSETPQLLQRLAAARLDRYQVGVEAGSAAAAGAAALADDLGMSESELLRALDAATEAELTQRIGPDLTAGLLANGAGCGGSCSGSGGGSGSFGENHSGDGCRRRQASGCIEVPRAAAAAGERLRGLLLEMSVGAPEELPMGPGCPETGSSARSTALSYWGSDEGGTPRSLGGICGAAAAAATEGEGGCSVGASAGASFNMPARRPLGLMLSPVRARRFNDRSNGRGSLSLREAPVPAGLAFAAAGGDYVPLSLAAGAAGGWPPRAASAGAAPAGGSSYLNAEPGLWLDVLENELARESALAGGGLPSPVKGVVRRPRTAH